MISEREQRDGVPELPPHRDGLHGVLPGALPAVRPPPARQIGDPQTADRREKRRGKLARQNSRGFQDDQLLTTLKDGGREGWSYGAQEVGGPFCRVGEEARAGGDLDWTLKCSSLG